jgi:hypothetical protein
VPNPTDLEERVADLEAHVRKLLLVVSAAGALFAEIRRHDDEGDT